MKPRRAALRAVAAASMAGLLSFVAAAQSEEPPSVLVFSGTQEPRPGGAEHGNEVLGQLADETGEFTVEFTDDPAVLTAQNLANYDVVLWNSPSGQDDAAPFSDDQRQQYVAWTQCGGGFVAVGQAVDAWSDWTDWDELVGFVTDSRAEATRTLTVTGDGPAAAAFGAKGSTFSLADEFYAVTAGKGPDDLSSDVATLVEDAGTPVAWTATFRGANQSFVTALGTKAATWDLPAFRKHVVEGIAHAASVRPDAECVAAIDGGANLLPVPVPATMVVLSPAAASSTNPVRYTPDTIVLAAGSSIEFANADTVTHTLTDASGRKLFDSGFVNLGASATVAGVEKLPAGTYEFVCLLHPVMVGTLTIV